MRRILIILSSAGLLAGCAGSHTIEAKSRTYQEQANAARDTGDYNLAQRDQDEAERLHQKAIKRAVKEGNANEVSVPATPTETPATVPAPEPTPEPEALPPVERPPTP